MTSTNTKKAPLSQLNHNNFNQAATISSSSCIKMELSGYKNCAYTEADANASIDFSNAGTFQLGMLCANSTMEDYRNGATFQCISLSYSDKLSKQVGESEEGDRMRKKMKIEGKTPAILSEHNFSSNIGSDDRKSSNAGLMISKLNYLQNYHHISPKLGTWLFVATLCVSDKSSRLACARGITAASDGATFVVADSGKGTVKRFDLSGNLITSMEIVKDTLQKQTSQIRQVAVSLDDKCFVTDKTQYVLVFDVVSGEYLHRFGTSSLMNNLSNMENIQHSRSNSETLRQLSGLTVDETNSCLLVGDVKQNLITFHQQDGTYLKAITTTMKPWYLATTQRLIIISSPIEQTVQVVDQQGRLLHILHGPNTWMPTGLYCSMDMIYVCNFASDCSGVYAFSSITGEYFGCACSEVSDPTGVAFVDGGKKMVVAQWGRGGVRLFMKGLNKDKICN